MAKATKAKAAEKVEEVKPVVEETKTGITTPVIETPVEEIKEEPIIETPVEEIKVEEPIIEEKVEIPEPIKEELPVIKTEPIKEVSAQDKLSMEDKILLFLKDKKGEVKMNDFLKSLFGVPTFNEPPKWASQGASKLMRNTLDKMVRENGLRILNDQHMKLSTFHYPDTATMKTEYHNLNTVPIICVM